MNKDEAINVINDYDINFERNTAEEIAEAFEMAIKAIRTIPSEDEKVIRIKKGTLKARTGKYVIYDVEWLKEHFNTTEAKIYGQPKAEDARGKEMNELTKIKCRILARIETYIADIEFAEEKELTEDEKTIFKSVKNIVNNEFEKASYKKEKGKDTFKLEFELPMEFKKDFEEDELMGQNRMYDCFARIGAEIRADMKWADMKFSAGKSRPSVSELSISPYYAEISDVLKESFADAVVIEEEGKLKVSIELPSGYKKDFEKSTEGNSNVTEFLAMAVSEIDGGHMDIAGTYEREICVALRDAFLKVLIKPDKEKKIEKE